MSRLLTCVLVGSSLILSQGSAVSQSTESFESLKKELDLQKREIELLKRENDLLKKENEVLKKGGAGKASAGDDSDAVLRATVGNVEYVWQGTHRVGSMVVATVLATSKDGNQQGPNGSMVIIDPAGEKFTGYPARGFGGLPNLREGVPVKMFWNFGATSAFGGRAGTAPSAKITRYAGVQIHRTVANDDNTIDFRNVPAIIEKAKGK